MSKDRELNAESSFATRRAALGMTAAMAAGLLAEQALSPDSARAEGVSSVNGKTGVVVLTASNVEAVPTSEVGKPKGVAELNSEGKLVEGELPNSVVTGAHHKADASGNIAIGSDTALTSGEENTALGVGSLAVAATANYNTAVGCNALSEFIGAPGIEGYNVAIGNGAMRYATTASGNVCVGTNAGSSLTTGGTECVAIGCEAMAGGTGTGATGNVAIGFESLNVVTTGGANIAVGYQSLFRNTTGEQNVAVGKFAMEENVSGSNNVALGMWALFRAKEAEENVAVGKSSLSQVTKGHGNAAVGDGVLGTVTTGYNNAAIGAAAGWAATGGSYGNVFIGFAAGPATEKEVNNHLYIANSETDTPLIKGLFPHGELQFNAEKLGFNQKAPVALIGENLSTGVLKVKSSGYGFATETEAKAALKFIEKLSAWCHEAGLTA